MGSSPRDVSDPNYCAPASRRRRRSLKSDGGRCSFILSFHFLPFHFVSCSLYMFHFALRRFIRSLTHSSVRQFLCSFISESQLLLSRHCHCPPWLPLLILLILSMANSDMIWGSEDSDYCFCSQQYLTILHKDNKHPTTLKHAIGKFNIGHNFLRLFGFLIVQTSKGVQLDSFQLPVATNEQDGLPEAP